MRASGRIASTVRSHCVYGAVVFDPQRLLGADRAAARSGYRRSVDRSTGSSARDDVHYDIDFEIAAEVLRLDHRWVLPRGTV